ncbi:hypothetical protein [Streptomyces sp. NPDC059575]|uniref:hypothetical protein n=1 Tax=Streptomyces sp. NPDC059575 TaxID=3346872 RepID=UPI00369F759A
MDEIENAVASAVVYWRTADEGGRRSGPPMALVYMATAVFALSDESKVQPGWPASADQLSILLQKTSEFDDGRWSCAVGFLVPDLARPHLHPGAELLVLEGPRTVAVAHITEVFDPEKNQ